MPKIERLMHHTGGILFNMAVKGWYFKEQAELNVQWIFLFPSVEQIFTMVYWYILLYIVF